MITLQKFTRPQGTLRLQRTQPLPRAVRWLALAMAASAAMQGSYVAPAHAAASDITESAAPVLGSAPAASAALADGDSSSRPKPIGAPTTASPVRWRAVDRLLK